MSLAPVVNGNADFLQIVSPGQKTIGVNGGAMMDHRGGEKLCLSHKSG